MSEATGAAPLLVLTGVTAAGKKEVGFELARRHGAELLALDSVKVFRGLRIGAARPRRSELQGLRLHLCGIADPRRPFSLGGYLEAAAAAVAAIRGRGRLALFLGGTPLYLLGLLRGLFAGPAADPAIRARLAREAAQCGVPALHARLAAVDPEAAARILAGDLKRITRALEVHELTGQPISRLQRERTRPRIAGEFRVAALRLAPEELRRRQELRVARMFERGLVREVTRLERRGLLKGEAAAAIGYAQVLAHLRGEISLAEAREQILVATRRLAARQQKWFRRFPEIRFVERAAGDSLEHLTAAVASALRL